MSWGENYSWWQRIRKSFGYWGGDFPTPPTPNLDLLYVRRCLLLRKLCKPLFDAKHLEKGSNRGWWNFCSPFFAKKSALLVKYQMLP